LASWIWPSAFRISAPDTSSSASISAILRRADSTAVDCLELSSRKIGASFVMGPLLPMKISAKISYRDSEGKEFQTVVQHDLEIYKDISYILKPEGKKLLPTVE
jgi:hypothetical protein